MPYTNDALNATFPILDAEFTVLDEMAFDDEGEVVRYDTEADREAVLYAEAEYAALTRWLL